MWISNFLREKNKQKNYTFEAICEAQIQTQNETTSYRIVSHVLSPNLSRTKSFRQICINPYCNTKKDQNTKYVKGSGHYR